MRAVFDGETSNQGHEETIENMKIQFAAISEKKAEVELKLAPLNAESNKLKAEMDDFETRREQHSVSASRDLLYHWTLSPLAEPDRGSGRGARESDE